MDTIFIRNMGREYCHSGSGLGCLHRNFLPTRYTRTGTVPVPTTQVHIPPTPKKEQY